MFITRETVLIETPAKAATSSIVALKRQTEDDNHLGELISLFDAANDARWEDVDRLYQQIADLENQADDQKRLVRSTLPRGFFLPVARADLLDLVGRQDKIANRSRDIAGLVHGRRLQFPVEVQPKLSLIHISEPKRPY